ncbi:MAG: DUF6152 family protein [Hyphomicrobiaceae bacterium]
MPRMFPGLWLLPVLAALPLQGPVKAHHTFVTRYDSSKLVTVSGTITSVSFTNPHIFFDLSGKAKSGGEVTWRIETEGILAARAKGLTEQVLKAGASVTVTGWLGRESAAEIGLKSISLQGGRTISMRKSAR